MEVDVFGLSEGIIRILVQNRPNERVSHFGVITMPKEGINIMTDLNQLGDLGTGTNDFAQINKNSDLYEFHRYHDIKVDNIESAQAMQMQEIARGSFPYKVFEDDCLIHTAKVLEAGGVDVDSSSARRQVVFMRRIVEPELKDFDTTFDASKLNNYR